MEKLLVICLALTLIALVFICSEFYMKHKRDISKLQKKNAELAHKIEGATQTTILVCGQRLLNHLRSCELVYLTAADLQLLKEEISTPADSSKMAETFAKILDAYSSEACHYNSISPPAEIMRDTIVLFRAYNIYFEHGKVLVRETC